MGHNHGTNTGLLPDLNYVAGDLKSGDKIKDAYFDRHDCSISSTHWDDPADGPTWCKPSALSVSSDSCCTLIWNGSAWVPLCPVAGCSGNYLDNDTWYPATDTDSVDLSSGFFYIQAWEVGSKP